MFQKSPIENTGELRRRLLSLVGLLDSAESQVDPILQIGGLILIRDMVNILGEEMEPWIERESNARWAARFPKDAAPSSREDGEEVGYAPHVQEGKG